MPSDAEQWAERRMEELLPCIKLDYCQWRDGVFQHDSRCPGYLRDSVAAELARLAEQVEQAREERDEAFQSGFRAGLREYATEQQIAALDEEASDG